MANDKGSLEVYFTFPSSTSKAVELVTDILGRKQFFAGTPQPGAISVAITSTKETSAPVFIQVQLMIDGVVIDQSDFSTYTEAEATFAIRVFFFDQFISVHLNDKWVYSYALAMVEYPEDVTAILRLNGATTTISGIRRVELADGREAIFVDYESTTESAIQSIIQQRPIQIVPHVHRKLSFTYRAERDTVNAIFVSRYGERTSHPSSMSSDGLVYGDDVGVSIDIATAREVGFITRLYRLPDLNTGAVSATKTMQRQARERRVVPDVTQRFDPRLELTDVLHVDMVVAGTNRVIERDVIIENMSITLRDGEYSMTISGRKKS